MSEFCEFATTSEQSIKDDRYYEHLCGRLGMDIAEKIYSLCSMGEKIVSISEPKTVKTYEPYTVEVRMYCDIADLVRCKDCKSGRPYKHTTKYVACEADCEPIDRDSDFFCAYGKRRSE